MQGRKSKHALWHDRMMLAAIVSLGLFLFVCLLLSCNRPPEGDSCSAMFAKAADRKPLRPLCHMPELVILGSLEDKEWDAHVEGAVTWWNEQLTQQALLNGARGVLLYGTNDRPPFIGIRTAPQDMVEEWSEQRIGLARSRWDKSGTCKQGTAIWIRDTCRSELVFDNECMSEKKLSLIITHELGHAIGFRHSMDIGTIMHKKVGPTVTKLRLGEDTLAELEEMYGKEEK